MAVRTSLNVSLTPELEAFVQKRVASGLYQTASEVIREGLRLLEHRERENEASLAALKRKLKRASDLADRGQFIDPDETLKKIAAMKARRAGGKK